MGTAVVTFGKVGARGQYGNIMVYRGAEVRSESITTSATSAQGTLVATAKDIAKIYSSTPVYAKSGSNPTAAAATSVYCPAGIETYIALDVGHKIAVIDG